MYYKDKTKRFPTIYKLWEADEKVGTVALRAFQSGQIPKRMRTGIRGFFRKFTGLVNRSRLEQGRKAKEKAKT